MRLSHRSILVPVAASALLLAPLGTAEPYVAPKPPSGTELEALARRWWVEEHEIGKTVWAELPLARPAG